MGNWSATEAQKQKTIKKGVFEHFEPWELTSWPKKKENKNLTVKKFFPRNFPSTWRVHVVGDWLTTEAQKTKNDSKRCFWTLWTFRFHFLTKERKKKNFFSEKSFSPPVPISGTNPGPDSCE